MTRSDFDVWMEISEELENDFDYRFARKILDITETICKIMHENNIKRTDLAIKMGVNRARVSEILNNPTNLTIETLLKVADALDVEFDCSNLFAGRKQPGKRNIVKFPAADRNEWEGGLLPDTQDYHGFEDGLADFLRKDIRGCHDDSHYPA